MKLHTPAADGLTQQFLPIVHVKLGNLLIKWIQIRVVADSRRELRTCRILLLLDLRRGIFSLLILIEYLQKLVPVFNAHLLCFCTPLKLRSLRICYV